MEPSPHVLPYGGDLAVARSIARVHQPDRSGRCRAPSCRAPHPCRDWRAAYQVIKARDPQAAASVDAAPTPSALVRVLRWLLRHTAG